MSSATETTRPRIRDSRYRPRRAGPRRAPYGTVHRLSALRRHSISIPDRLSSGLVQTVLCPPARRADGRSGIPAAVRRAARHKTLCLRVDVINAATVVRARVRRREASAEQRSEEGLYVLAVRNARE